MTTIDNIMALADEYAISVADAPHHPTPLLRAMAVEKIERAREALRAALNEALVQQIDTSTKRVEKSGENVKVQQTPMPFVPWSKECEMMESWTNKNIGCVGHDCAECKASAAQPVRGPSCETCKHCTVASQDSFEETCFVCSQYYNNKYEAKSDPSR